MDEIYDLILGRDMDEICHLILGRDVDEIYDLILIETWMKSITSHW